MCYLNRTYHVLPTLSGEFLAGSFGFSYDALSHRTFFDPSQRSEHQLQLRFSVAPAVSAAFGGGEHIGN